ncbi:MAG: hypothetical protein KatS3mg081_0322 [Gemmatimonadales bacterium]|nr:MAG: hypothetical protein KatS3mg081_0322 [Gemmatimonadales bacterium]
MACGGCARRARALLTKLGFAHFRLGPNRRAGFVFETPDVAVVITTPASVCIALSSSVCGRRC